MSNEALRRTIRRTGAVVVFALGTLLLAFRGYLSYQGIPVDVPSFVFVVLFFGPLAYLAGSFLVGVMAVLDGSPGADAAGGEEKRVGGGEGSADGSE